MQQAADTAQPGWADTIRSILATAIEHKFVTLTLIAIIGIFYGWNELRKQQAAKGRPLRPLGTLIRGTIRFAVKEDNVPLITKPKNLAAKTVWLTGKRLYIIGLPLSIAGAKLGVPFATLAIFAILVVLSQRTRKFNRMRHSIIMQMFNVAHGECRYPKGAELNPWAYINVQAWQSPSTPGATIVTYPASYQSEESKTREKFERQFNGTVSDQNSWTYQWESSKNRVICQPSSFLPTMATYPGPGEEWDKIPIGISADGGYSQWDVRTFPHALVCGPTGTGKQNSLSQTVPTPTGWTTVGDLAVGDYILGDNGLPTKVEGLSPITFDGEAFEVEFSDGTVITADADHLWWTETRQARMSRWTEAKRQPKRRALLTGDQVRLLESALGEADDLSEITIRDAAGIAGVCETSPWVRDLAAHVGQVGEVQFDVVQHYGEQVVKSSQWVRRWAAREAWTALAVKQTQRPWKFERFRPVFVERARTEAPGLFLSATEVGELLGIDRSEAVSLLQQSGAECVKAREVVSQHVPEKSVVKKSTWTAVYPAKRLLAAMIEHGRLTPYDQRHKKVLGGVRTTRDILETLRTTGGHANHSVPVAAPLVLPERVLPIAPYTFGAWLGDGTSWHAEVCGIDHEVARWIEKDGYQLSERTPTHSTADGQPRHPDFRIWGIQGIRRPLATLGVLKTSKEQGLTKFIPVEYLRASESQRRALLAGLLDTDGTVDPEGTASITQVNERLARDIFELVNSLGLKASFREGRATLNGVDHGPTWTVEFAAPVSPFNLSRKTDTFEARSRWSAERNSRRWIVDVRPVASVPMRCVRVDNESKLFLVGDSFIATHNSVLQRNILFHCLAHSDSWRIFGIDPKRVELQWVKKYPTVMEVATELDDALDVLRGLKNEMHRRYQEMESEGVNIYTSLRDKPPAILLMVDETTILLAPEKIRSDEGKIRDDMHAEASMILGELGRLARAAGIHVIACMQRPDAEFLKGETKANFDCRIVAGRTDTTPSMMILDSEAATRLPLIKGRGMIRLGGQMQTFQGFYAEGDWFDDWLEKSAAAEAAGEAAEGGEESPRRGPKLPGLPKLPRVPLPGFLVKVVSAIREKASTPPSGLDRASGEPEGDDLLGVEGFESEAVSDGFVEDVEGVDDVGEGAVGEEMPVVPEWVEPERVEPAVEEVLPEPVSEPVPEPPTPAPAPAPAPAPEPEPAPVMEWPVAAPAAGGLPVRPGLPTAPGGLPVAPGGVMTGSMDPAPRPPVAEPVTAPTPAPVATPVQAPVPGPVMAVETSAPLGVGDLFADDEASTDVDSGRPKPPPVQNIPWG